MLNTEFLGFFFFQSFEYIGLLSSATIFWWDIICWSSLDSLAHNLFLAAFKIVFWQFDYDISKCGSLWVYSRIHWATWKCKLMYLIKFGNIWPLFSSNILSASSISYPWDSQFVRLVCYFISHRSQGSFHFTFFLTLFLRLENLKWPSL